MLKVKQLNFSYDQSQVILNDISFSAEAGEHLSIIGESGSGKTTLLKLLRGEYDLDEGEILWKDEQILGPKYNLVIGYDFMKYVAQEFELMPFISVEENIGKHLSNFFKKEKKNRVEELIEVVDLKSVAKTKVKSLSGGQKQRVALARALAKQPELLLMDEPFSHIDNAQKQGLRRRMFNYLKKEHITCIVATHDREDVLGYADRMIVLNENKIAVNDTPKNLYHKPKTDLIAAFFSEYSMINGAIVYANQLRVVGDSKLEVIVQKSYFKGHYVLVEAKTEAGNTILFEHESELKFGSKVYLEINK